MAHINDFMAKAETDETLRGELMAIDRNGDWASEATRIANAHGYEFSADDLKAAVQDRYEGDLSEDALDKVAGGTSNAPFSW